MKSNLTKTLSQPATRFDPVLAGVIFLLCLVGVVMIFSASTSLSDRLYGSSLILLRNHLVHMIVGVGAMVGAMYLPYEKLQEWVPLALVGMLIILVLVLIPGIGHEVGGARRWLRLGPFNFQPTELLKLVLIFHVASFLDRKQVLISQFMKGIVPTLTVMGVFLALVLMQPDFGSMVLIALTLLTMIFVGGAQLGHILSSLLGFLVIGIYLVASKTYRLKRFLAFLDPWADRLDTGFQIVQSYLAFGSGGWFGMGLGESRQKMFFLPEAHTDFIFAILGEEFGLMGSLVVVVLFGIFFWRGFRASLAARGDFGRYLAFGITTLFATQMLINLAVVMGLMPTKGLPLPFISYGGSSLVMNLFMVGLLLNIERQGRSSS